jgi:DNA-binding NarL/FixJ family response regulator
VRTGRSRRAASSPVVVEIVFDLVVVMIDRSGTDDRLTALTARQVQVLALMAAGRSNAAIAARLAITEKAVVRHATDALGRSIVTPKHALGGRAGDLGPLPEAISALRMTCGLSEVGPGQVMQV